MMNQWVTGDFPTVFEPPVGGYCLRRVGVGQGAAQADSGCSGWV